MKSRKKKLFSCLENLKDCLPSAGNSLEHLLEGQDYDFQQRAPSIHGKAFLEQEHLLPDYQDKLGPGYKKKTTKLSDVCAKKKESVSNKRIKINPNNNQKLLTHCL